MEGQATGLILSVMSCWLCVAVTAFWEPEISSSTCCASGDPHYETFDDAWVHFQGRCRYLLAGTCGCGPNEAFHVFVDNEPFPNHPAVSRTDRVEIHYRGHTVIFQAFQQANIDGVSHALSWPFTGIPGVTVSYSWSKFTFQSDSGIVVTYEYDHIACVTVPCMYKGDMCGICGNMNDDERDDFVMSNGTDVSAHPNKYSLIGSSWRVAGGTCAADYVEPIGDYWPQLANSACCNKLDPLVESSLQVCAREHPRLARAYKTVCSFDAAVLGDPGCCGMLEVFVQRCRILGVDISNNWRNDFPQCRPAEHTCAGDLNPCARARQTGQFYYTHPNPFKFVQCDEWGGCFEMPCAPGTQWDQFAYSCV